MFRLGARDERPLDQLRPGLLQVILHRLRALNENTRLLLRLLEADWRETSARTLNGIRDRILH